MNRHVSVFLCSFLLLLVTWGVSGQRRGKCDQQGWYSTGPYAMPLGQCDWEDFGGLDSSYQKSTIFSCGSPNIHTGASELEQREVNGNSKCENMPTEGLITNYPSSCHNITTTSKDCIVSLTFSKFKDDSCTELDMSHGENFIPGACFNDAFLSSVECTHNTITYIHYESGGCGGRVIGKSTYEVFLFLCSLFSF